MDSRPDINTVHQAICTLYGQDAQASGKASVWLGEFQKSLFAWEISDKLLLERRDEVSCYFAAQTMRTKIQYSFHELPSETYQSLRDSIMLHLGTCLNLPTSQCKSVVITQLCLALVDLYLQVPSWKGYVAEIINKFSSGAETSLLLLNILKVFPEENESQHLRLGANRRQEIWVELSQQTNTVLEFLSKICQTHSNDEETLQKSFGCLSSWLINPEVPTDGLAQSPLLQSILELLKNPVAPSSLHEAGTDCIVAALFKAEMQNYARLFTELAESTIQHLLDTPGQGLGDFITLELLLVTIGYHDYSLAEMTFNVWYRLSEMLYQTDSDPLTEMFRPYATRFILALYRHCRFDSDFDGTPDDNEEFRDFRDRAREAARDVVFISGAEPTLKHLFEILKTQGPQSSWDETESALYIMASISKNILPNEDEVVPHVVDAVLQLPPSTHLCLRFTAIRLLGQINEWINNNPQYCVLKLGRRKREVTDLVIQHRGYGRFHFCEKNGDRLETLAIFDDNDPDEPEEELAFIKRVVRDEDASVKFRSLRIEDFEVETTNKVAWVPYNTYRTILSLIPAVKYEFVMPSIKLMPYFSANVGDTGREYVNFITNFLITKPSAVIIKTAGMNFLNMSDFEEMKSKFETFKADCTIEVKSARGGCMYKLHSNDDVGKPAHIPCLHHAYMNDAGHILQFKVWFGDLGLDCGDEKYDV